MWCGLLPLVCEYLGSWEDLGIWVWMALSLGYLVGSAFRNGKIRGIGQWLRPFSLYN